MSFYHIAIKFIDTHELEYVNMTIYEIIERCFTIVMFWEFVISSFK